MREGQSSEIRFLEDEDDKIETEEKPYVKKVMGRN